MPGFFFHTLDSAMFFDEHFPEDNVYQKTVYSILPDSIWGFVDGQTYERSHSRNSIDRIADYVEQTDGDPWIHMMMRHHKIIDHIVDNKTTGSLNGLHKELEKRLKKFKMPDYGVGLIMDIALDLAQYDVALKHGIDAADILTISQACFNPEPLGKALAYGYSEDEDQYLELADTMTSFNFYDMKTQEGIFDAVMEYYIDRSKKRSKKTKFGDGKLKNWFKRKGIELVFKNQKARKEIFDITQEARDTYVPMVDDIHAYIKKRMPSVDVFR